jgi:hypothetical protein
MVSQYLDREVRQVINGNWGVGGLLNSTQLQIFSIYWECGRDKLSSPDHGGGGGGKIGTSVFIVMLLQAILL